MHTISIKLLSLRVKEATLGGKEEVREGDSGGGKDKKERKLKESLIDRTV